MPTLYGNAIIGQSGGPSSAINATLSGIIRGCYACEGIEKVYGVLNGIEGLLERRIICLLDALTCEEDFALLEQTPGAVLGSCRKRIAQGTAEENTIVFEQLVDIFRDYNIRYFFYIGGNDSMDTAAKISDYMSSIGYEMRIIGVPKTIDNDLVGTDHTPGFGSAAKYIAATMQEILRDTAVYTTKAVTLVELMGRESGWLTAAAALPLLDSDVAPDLVYLPEADFDYDIFYDDVETALEKHPNVVVALSEGIHLKNDTFVGESMQSGMQDAFGHKYLSGAAKALEASIRNRFNCKVRSIELNLPQRCAAHMASATDIEEAVAIGRAAVEVAQRGETGKMIAFVRKEGEEYGVDFTTVDLASVANAVRLVPREFINTRGNYVTEACLRYIQPLIVGETKQIYKNGLPMHFSLPEHGNSEEEV